MKTYTGTPATPEAPAKVEVQDGHDAPAELNGIHPFGWGKRDPVATAHTAEAILRSHLGDGPLAQRLYRRFMWRTLTERGENFPFTMTGQEVQDVVDDILEAEREAARRPAPVATGPGPVAHEGGMGAGGVPVKWDQTPALKPNAPLK